MSELVRSGHAVTEEIGARIDARLTEFDEIKVSTLQKVSTMFSYPRPAADYAALLGLAKQRVSDAVQAATTEHTRYPVRLMSLEKETHDCQSIWLKTSKAWRRASRPCTRSEQSGSTPTSKHHAGFLPGQYVLLHVNIDGVWQSRCYSISGYDARKKAIRLTIKQQANGLVSNYLAKLADNQQSLGKGEFFIGRAQGEFVLSAVTQQRAYLFITAGSGITPIMAMLNELLNDKSDQQDLTIQHIHYAPNAQNVIFADQLKSWSEQHKSSQRYQLHTITTASSAKSKSHSSGHHSGHFSEEQLTVICPDWQSRETWACGPEALLGAVEHQWQQAGLAEQLHTERFRPVLAACNQQPDVDTKVHFAASDKHSQQQSENLLLTAEKNGLSPKLGCRMGICHSCDCRLLSGAVQDLRTGAVIDQPGHFIQPCVSAALSDVSLDL